MASGDLLTQDEVDALLEGVSAGIAEAGDGSREPGDEVLPYRLVSPENALTGILPVLENIHERFAHRLRAGLFELLQRDVEVVASALETRSYPDLITSLTCPCSVNIVGLRPLSGPALLVFERPLVFVVVDTFFGGRGRMYSAPTNRDFTATEARLIQRLLNLTFRSLNAAWQPFVAVDCAHFGAESNPQFVTAINPTELLVVASVQIEMEQSIGALHLALPCSMFEPVRGLLLSSLSKEHPSPSERLTRLLREGVKSSRVDLRAVFTETELTVRELLALGVGDILSVEMPSRAILEAEGVAIYAGRYGVAQGRRALKVETALARLAIEAVEPHTEDEKP